MYEIAPGIFASKNWTDIIIICPVGHINDARDIAIDYIKKKNPSTREGKNDMLPHKLSPTGNNPATHYMCIIREEHSEADRMATRILQERANGKSFCANGKRTDKNDRSSLNQEFTVIIGNREDILSKLGLKVIK